MWAIGSLCTVVSGSVGPPWICLRAGAAIPTSRPEDSRCPPGAPGVPLADEAPFRDASITALVISDTGAQRMPEIRTGADIPQVLNFGAMAQRVRVLASVVAEQANL